MEYITVKAVDKKGIVWYNKISLKRRNGMRNVTIRRAKSFAACLGKVKVYVEDPTASELTINGIPCRKLGDLKNGEEKTFQVSERAAKIFAIGDKISRNIWNECYQLPEGQEDIVLCGQNKFNPARGNPFLFDHNDSPENAANRKRGTRIGIVILIVAVALGAVLGFTLTTALFSQRDAQPKVFSDAGMTVTLTNEFKKATAEGYTTAYDSKNVAVFALKESFSSAPGMADMTLAQYANLVLQANGYTSSQVHTADGLTWFEFDFTNTQTNEKYHYFAYMYKANDAFWLVQFATLSENVQTYKADIAGWAKSVTFGN